MHDARTRVLVVDDEAPLRNAFVRALQTAGFEVDSAEDGSSAAALIAERNYGAIVSDIGLPGMDGVELLRKVRARDLDVPVILMTGNPALDSAIGAVELGALLYLVKPFETTVLQKAVTRAVRLHELARLKREALAVTGGNDRAPSDLASLRDAFDRALASLWMAFQPIVDTRARRIHAFEALMRSQEPLLPHPGAVLDAAERLGRLVDLGRAVRERTAVLIPSAPAENVFINLHPSDLLDDELYAPSATLSRVAGRVVLEITERSALGDVPNVAQRVAKLRALGFRVAVDDLGAGYAGLSSFASLEPEVVKFDMSLVRGVHENAHKRKLICSMTALFDELGLTVIAEGVETAAERDALIDSGCRLHQGYLFAKPGKPFPEVAW